MRMPLFAGVNYAAGRRGVMLKERPFSVPLRRERFQVVVHHQISVVGVVIGRTTEV